MATATKTKGNNVNINEPLPEWKKRLTVGHKYFVQTCTKDWVGMLLDIQGPYTLVLGPDPDQKDSQASWVAESGRLHAFVRDGKADGMEIEPVGVVSCQWVDWIPWDHPLFTEAI